MKTKLKNTILKTLLLWGIMLPTINIVVQSKDDNGYDSRYDDDENLHMFI